MACCVDPIFPSDHFLALLDFSMYITLSSAITKLIWQANTRAACRGTKQTDLCAPAKDNHRETWLCDLRMQCSCCSATDTERTILQRTIHTTHTVHISFIYTHPHTQTHPWNLRHFKILVILYVVFSQPFHSLVNVFLSLSLSASASSSH